jgi:hypothetical protein
MAFETLYVDADYLAPGFVQTGVTIDWPNLVIHVPKIAMDLVQTSPTIIYELDLNVFRNTLKDLEDDPEGMSSLDTHAHNTSVTVGGATLARVVEIINNYTITFEDDRYAVNLLGANSNVADKVNVNQVSVRAGNSAGLVEVPSVESDKISEIWKILGLDPINIQTITDTSITVDGINITLTRNELAGTTILDRQ